MPRLLESAKKIGRKIGSNEENIFISSVFIALIIVASVVGAYYLILNPQPEEYNTLYILDSKEQAVDYPLVLVAEQNSTFSVYVAVENHMNEDRIYQVRVKIIENLPALFPLDIDSIRTYDFFIPKGEYDQKQVTLTENNTGKYAVIFELWIEDSGEFRFAENYCVLKINVIN